MHFFISKCQFVYYIVQFVYFVVQFVYCIVQFVYYVVPHGMQALVVLAYGVLS